MPDGTQIPPLPKGYEPIDTSVPPLPKGYFDLKKKVGSSDNGIDASAPSNPFLNAQKPTGTISQKQIEEANKGISASKNKNTEQKIAAGTPLEREMVSDKEAFDRDEINKAAINTAERYFKNNPKLIYNINSLKKKNEFSLKNATTQEDDLYSLKSLKNTTPFQRKVAEIKQAYENGDLALTHFQSGEKAQGERPEPVFTKSAKFLRGIGQGVELGLNDTKDAIVNMSSNDKEFADYLDKKGREIPEVPEEAPSGIGGKIGTQLGSLIKPVAEFSLGTAATSEIGGFGGLAALAADVIPSSTTAKTKQIYYENINKLREKYGDDIPEEERINAMKDARSNATLQAVPEEAMQMYLFGRGAGALGNIQRGGLNAFKNSLLKAGVDIPKMGALGGAEEAAALGIAKLQGYDTPDAAKKIGQAVEDWATVEAAFKIAHGIISAPKYLRSSAKEVISELPIEIGDKLSDEAIAKGWVTQEQADKSKTDLQQYKKIRETLPDDLPPEKASAVTGLLQKNETLEKQKETSNKILHDDIDAEIDNNVTKAKQILNSNRPLKYETDELTGERGEDVGGRPIVTNPKNTGKQTEENGITVIEPTVRPNENVSVEMPEQINRPETIEIGGKTEPKQPLSDREKEIFTDKTADINKIIASEKPKESNSINSHLNTEQNAIQERSAEEIPMGETSRDSGKMGERIPEPKEFAPTREESNKSKGDEEAKVNVIQPKTKLSHEGVDRLIGEFGLEDRPEKAREKVLDWEKEADDKILEGYDVDRLLDKMEYDKHRPSAVEHIILVKQQDAYAQKLREIKNIDSPEFNKIVEKAERIDRLSAVAGSAQGKELVARKYSAINDDTLLGFLLQEKKLNKDAPLTKQQKITAINEYEKINTANEDFKAKYEKLQEDYAKLLAEREFQKQRGTTKKNAKKTHEDFVKERKAYLDEFKEAKKKHEEFLKEKGIQKQGFGNLTLTPEMAKAIGKMIGSYIEEGISKLDDVVSKITEDLKEFNISDREVRNVIAGAYNEPKKTRNQVAEQRMNLKIQQQLIDKYEAMLKGEKPKDEKKLIRFNQEIHDLRQKIKGLEKEEKEANTRYREEIDERVKKLQELKRHNEKELEKIDEEFRTGNFKVPEKKVPLTQNEELKKAFPKAYKEALESQTLLIKARQARQLRMALREFQAMSERERALKQTVRYLNVPRTLMASMDFSAPLRQGVLATIAHPSIAKQAFGKMFGHTFNQAEFDRFYHDLQDSPRYEVYKESGLALTDPHSLHLDKQEEAYLGGNIAEKIPVIGGGVKASERAYVSYLNKLRMDLFDRFAERFEADGKTINNSPELYKQLASFVNTSTGRGGMGKMERIAPELSTVLFAPRLIASRLNMLGIGDIFEWGTRALTLNKVKLGIGYYTKLPKELRVAAVVDMLKLIGTGITFLAAAKYGLGADVEIDPRSSDFGKIKIGNTRWDIWGGLQPYVRLFAQLAAGSTKSANSGKVYELGDSKPFGRTRTDVIGTSVRGKLAPVPSAVWDLISGRTAIGEKIDRRFDIPFMEDKNDAAEGEKTLTTFIGEHFIPLLFQDVKDAMKEQGVKGLFTVGVPSVFGVGVNTYEPRVQKSKGITIPKPPKPPKVNYPFTPKR